jgi:hypothetical protein
VIVWVPHSTYHDHQHLNSTRFWKNITYAFLWACHNLPESFSGVWESLGDRAPRASSVSACVLIFIVSCACVCVCVCACALPLPLLVSAVLVICKTCDSIRYNDWETQQRYLRTEKDIEREGGRDRGKILCVSVCERESERERGREHLSGGQSGEERGRCSCWWEKYLVYCVQLVNFQTYSFTQGSDDGLYNGFNLHRHRHRQHQLPYA